MLLSMILLLIMMIIITMRWRTMRRRRRRWLRRRCCCWQEFFCHNYYSEAHSVTKNVENRSVSCCCFFLVRVNFIHGHLIDSVKMFCVDNGGRDGRCIFIFRWGQERPLKYSYQRREIMRCTKRRWSQFLIFLRRNGLASHLPFAYDAEESAGQVHLIISTELPENRARKVQFSLIGEKLADKITGCLAYYTSFASIGWTWLLSSFRYRLNRVRGRHPLAHEIYLLPILRTPTVLLFHRRERADFEMRRPTSRVKYTILLIVLLTSTHGGRKDVWDFGVGRNVVE